MVSFRIFLFDLIYGNVVQVGYEFLIFLDYFFEVVEIVDMFYIFEIERQ